MHILKVKYIITDTEIPLINGIEFEDPKTKQKIIFDKNFIKKKITNNIGILNSYYKMIQKQHHLIIYMKKLIIIICLQKY